MKTIAVFIGLNFLDLLFTGIGLALGCVEVGWYASLGLSEFWHIVIAKIVLLGLILLLVRFWKFRPYIKYGNIVLAIICVTNLIAILLMI
jgi:hypothetical protein